MAHQFCNLITDIPGLRIGSAEDASAATGVTVILPDRPVTAAADVRGGGPGTRDIDALSLSSTVDEIHALVLSGGSGLGLGAATGVQTWLAERGIGFPVGSARVPIVPQAILFDLLNGGDKGWGTAPLYERLARSACDAAATGFALGSAGAGFGATTATLRGGLGSASEMLDGGMIVGAIVAANPVGSVIVGNSPHFWAAPFEQGKEFGGLRPAHPYPADALALRLKGVAARSNTTLGVVATNVCLDKRQLQRIAIMAQTGLARAIYPVHTPLDGDVVFALSTGEIALPDPIAALTRLGAAAANTLARAVARGIYHASPAPSFWTGPPAYATRFPSNASRAEGQP